MFFMPECSAGRGADTNAIRSRRFSLSYCKPPSLNAALKAGFHAEALSARRSDASGNDRLGFLCLYPADTEAPRENGSESKDQGQKKS